MIFKWIYTRRALKGEKERLPPELYQELVAAHEKMTEWECFQMLFMPFRYLQKEALENPQLFRDIQRDCETVLAQKKKEADESA